MVSTLHHEILTTMRIAKMILKLTLVKESNFIDSGGNSAINNSGCNGLYVHNINKCIRLLATSVAISTSRAPTATPRPNVPDSSPTTSVVNTVVSESKVTVARRGGVGYFNYDLNDNRYGPHRWGGVSNNPEYARYQGERFIHSENLHHVQYLCTFLKSCYSKTYDSKSSLIHLSAP